MKNQEKNLIIKVRNGDMKAYEKLMDIHVNKLRSFVAYRVPAQHLVNEIAHETFVFAFEKMDRFRPDASFGAWLRSIAFNKIRESLRDFAREQRYKREYLSELIAHSTLNDIPSPDSPMVEHLKSCVQELPDHLRELVNLKYHFTFSGSEIAQKLDRSISWVRTSLFRIRKALRKCIERKIMQEAS
ncbi:RNA polymerase sigma factor [Verrucomicrobiota bacterium]